ncbi:3-hydroxybutyryl-CoA dehydratase [Durusdinium trenchii]|uniref:3-hydroxybutyryl-CoA dehydratase n=1 Tax=Durusdinium trenchii TaxID=1381693 RepID=A0ABP0MNP2_9DINO
MEPLSNAEDFARCAALCSSVSPLRKAAEAALLQLRRSPHAAEVCGSVLLREDPTAAFHAAVTLKYSTLFHWPRLPEASREAAMDQMLTAARTRAGAMPSEWRPVQQQAMLAVALYWKKAFLEGHIWRMSISQWPLPLAAVICQELQDERNLGLLGCESQHCARGALQRAACELPRLLTRAVQEGDHAALAACAAWSFQGPAPQGWEDSCAQVAMQLAQREQWDLALDFAQCAKHQAMWALVLSAAGRPRLRFAAASCAATLATAPSEEEALQLARVAVQIMQEDLSCEEGLEQLDALVKFLEVLRTSSRSLEVTELLVHAFLCHILCRANLPDAYDETLLGGASSEACCSDVLRLMAQIAGAQMVEPLQRCLSQRGGDTLDMRHLALSFAVELVACHGASGPALAPVVYAGLQGCPSPLLVADSFRFFHRLLPHLDACDVAPLFQMTLLGLQRWATDPEVARVGLDLLTDLSRLPSSFPLFHSQFQAVWTDPHLPLTVITGFCRGLRLSSTYHPSGAAELAALAQPLRKAVLRQVEEWDPQVLSGPQLPLTARRFAALAALATVHPVEDQRLLEALETKLSDEFPEHLLPCAAPLLASLAQQGHSQLPTRVCTAMAQRLGKTCCLSWAWKQADLGRSRPVRLPASLGLQEHTLDLCEALLFQKSPQISEALAYLCTDEWEPRAFELLCSAEQLSPLAFHRLLSGLSHPDERLQTKAIQRLHALEYCDETGTMRPMLWRLLQVALSTECRPLLEALAELWRCATRATQCVAAMAWLAQELVVGISDQVTKALVLQSFEKLNAPPASKTHFLSFVAELRALTV